METRDTCNKAKITTFDGAWQAWTTIEPTVRAWAYRQWFDPEKARDVLQEGAIEFVRRFKPGNENQPQKFTFVTAKCSCIDAAKKLGPDYWMRADRKAPQAVYSSEIAEIVISTSAKYAYDPQKNGGLDERLAQIQELIKEEGDVKFEEAFQMLIWGYKQKEAAKKTGLSTSRISEKLATYGEKITGARRRQAVKLAA